MPIVATGITEPVSIDDVRTVLGLPRSPENNDVGYLCSNRHGKINHWAKHKPVRWDGLFSQSYKGSLPSYNPDMYRGQNQNCGLNIPKVDRANNPYWAIESPRGVIPAQGIYEPYRLSDFLGYRQNALPPFTTTMPLSLSNAQGSTFTLQIASTVGRENMIDLDDIRCYVDVDEYVALGEMYLGIIINNRFMTSTTKINAADSTYLYIPQGTFEEGEYVSVTLCASVTPQPTLISVIPNTLFSLTYDINGYENIAQRSYTVMSNTKYKVIGIKFTNIVRDGSYNIIADGYQVVFDTINMIGGFWAFSRIGWSGAFVDENDSQSSVGSGSVSGNSGIVLGAKVSTNLHIQCLASWENNPGFYCDITLTSSLADPDVTIRWTKTMQEAY